MTNYTLMHQDQEAVLRNKESGSSRSHSRRHYVQLISLGSIFCFVGLFVVLATSSLTIVKKEKRNVIIMISDGFGPASETFARQYLSWKQDLPVKTVFPLDKIIVGQSRTQSSSSLITDSAAGATAFSCGLKTYNGAIGVDPNKVPCGTVLESAKIHKKMRTGLVVTSRITHATPASFSAHINWRDWENQIAEHQLGYTPLGKTVDLMFGGGLCEFLKNTTQGSCRADKKDLIARGQKDFGWQLKTTRQEFDALDENAKMPLLGLFANQHMSFAIDRDPSMEPSLTEMTEKALAILKKSTKHTKQGFFLMIEGSRIDMAGHVNDAAAQFYEIWEYQRTVQAIMKFVQENPGTILISTSDHETGGLTVGRQITDTYPEYEWKPQVINQVKNSSEILSWMWAKAIQDQKDTREFLLDEIIGKGLGINDTTEEELTTLWEWKESGKTTDFFATALSDLVSKRAEIGWTTMGHTAVDVNLYAYGHKSELLRGNHENTDIGDFIVNYLDLDLNDITKRLNDDNEFKAKLAALSEEFDFSRLRSKHQLGLD